MKIRLFNLSIVTLFSVFSTLSFSQISLYNFSATAGTYTPITGGTQYYSLSTDGPVDDIALISVPIPAFVFNCITYNTLTITTNGFIAFGNPSAGLSTIYTPMATTPAASGGIVSVMGVNLVSATTGSPEIRAQQIGNEFIIQWKNFKRFNVTTEVLNFQIRLNTLNNNISFAYGQCLSGSGGPATVFPQIGIRGASNPINFLTDVKNLTLSCGASGWLGVGPGTATSSNVCLSTTTFPASGTTFTFASPGPSAPGSISGTTALCPGITGQTFSISPISGASSYNWTVPSGWTITSGQGTTNITVTAGNFGQNGSISVTASNTCGTSAASNLAVTVSPLPQNPGGIIDPNGGNNLACPGATLIFAVANAANASSYTWTVPPGWTISSGQGTNSITVTAGTTPGLFGNISVTANNTCGSSTVSSLPYNVGNPAPLPPAYINGSDSICPGGNILLYSVSSTAFADFYNWTVPAGWTITSGQGTNTISVGAMAITGQNGNISVTTSNSCGTSSACTLAVTVLNSPPQNPGNITGSNSVCPGTSSLIYAVNSNANATNYNWAVPNGWVITSGQGTNSISVVAGAAGQNGNIFVTADNYCGSSAQSILPVIVNNAAPTTPTAISGPAILCEATNTQSYSVTFDPTATNYIWTVPTGWNIAAGANTNSISVLPGALGLNGNITVSSENNCGTSGTALLYVSNNPNPTVDAGNDTTICNSQFPLTLTATGTGNSYLWSNGSSTISTSVIASGTYTVSATLNGCTTQDTIVVIADPCLSINETSLISRVYPNPTQSHLMVELHSFEEAPYTMFSLQGNIIKSGIIQNGEAILDVSSIASGKYLFRVLESTILIEILK